MFKVKLTDAIPNNTIDKLNSICFVSINTNNKLKK